MNQGKLDVVNQEMNINALEISELKWTEMSGWGTHVYLWRIHFDIWQI